MGDMRLSGLAEAGEGGTKRLMLKKHVRIQKRIPYNQHFHANYNTTTASSLI